MQYELLANPTHAGGEEHKDGHAGPDDLEGGEGLMNDDFINHHLGEERQTQPQQLDGQ